MREITTKVYKYEELNDEAKEKARDWYREGGLDTNSWEYIQEDAKQIGLTILNLDPHRSNKGEFKISALLTAETILANHGKDGETYKTASKYIDELKRIHKLEQEEDYSPVLNEDSENAEHEFLHELLEDYRIMYQKEEEYQNSDEQVAEMIIANEYEFTEEGKRI